MNLKSLISHFEFSDWCSHLESFILQKTQLKSNKRLESYKLLKDFQNNTKQEIHFLFRLYLKINIPDFRLIPPDCLTNILEW